MALVWYTLKKTMQQIDFHFAIFRAESYEYKTIVETELEKLKATDIDEDTFIQIQEYEAMMADGNVCERIGFLYLEQLAITKVEFRKKGFRLILYKNGLHLEGSDADMKKLFELCGVNYSRLKSQAWISIKYPCGWLTNIPEIPRYT